MAATGIEIAEGLATGAPVGPQLFKLLRDRIVRGELEPGMRLSEVDIAHAYGTSRQPVREAFIKLAEASLIEVRPQRGSYVRRIDMSAVLSAQFVREAVEAEIVRSVAAQASATDLGGLDALLTRQAETVDDENPQPFMMLDEDFHRQLARIAGRGEVWEVLQPLRTQMDRVRHLSVRQFPRRVLVQHHIGIVNAIRAHDADEAERRMRHHLRRILEDVPVVAAERPAFFDMDDALWRAASTNDHPQTGEPACGQEITGRKT